MADKEVCEWSEELPQHAGADLFLGMSSSESLQNISATHNPLNGQSGAMTYWDNSRESRLVASGGVDRLIPETGELVKTMETTTFEETNKRFSEDNICGLDCCQSNILKERHVVKMVNSDEMCRDMSSCTSLDKSGGNNKPRSIFKVTKQHCDSSTKISHKLDISPGKQTLSAIPKYEVKSAPGSSATEQIYSRGNPRVYWENCRTVPAEEIIATQSSEANDNFIYGIYVLEEYLKDMQALCKKNWQIIQRSKDVFYNQLLPAETVSHKEDFQAERNINDERPELNKSTSFIPKTFLRLGLQQSLQNNIFVGNNVLLKNQSEDKQVLTAAAVAAAASKNIAISDTESNIFQIPFQNCQKFKILEENRILKNELKYLQITLSSYENQLQSAKEDLQKLNKSNSQLSAEVRKLRQENGINCKLVESLSSLQELPLYLLTECRTLVIYSSVLFLVFIKLLFACVSIARILSSTSHIKKKRKETISDNDIPTTAE